MSVLDRQALEQSPLADLHAIASELSIDGYRLLRREQLIEAILARQEGADRGEETSSRPRRRRERRSPATREAATRKTAASGAAAPEAAASGEPATAEPEAPVASEPPSADRARFEAMAARFPDELLSLGAEDPILGAIESLTPIGKGSRVTIVGPAMAGKSETLRRLAGALAQSTELQILLVLAGVRPEEISEWDAGPVRPLEALSLAAPPSAQDRAVYGAIDRARSIAVAGEHAVVLLDTLDGVHEHAARRALATARRLVEGGSVTVIATSSEPVGGETTVIALDPLRADGESQPALDLRSSGTLRAELLVGADRAAAIARARIEARRSGEPQ